MKKIYLIFAAVATLLFAPGLFAQNNGVVANKSAIDGDGNYTLSLETYVTGKVHSETDMRAVDVMLIMDISSSMESTVGSDHNFTEETKPVTLRDNKVFTAVSKAVTEAGTRDFSSVQHEWTALDQGWTYSNSSTAPTGTNAFPKYYKDGDNYYRVFSEYVSSRRRLYIMIGTVRWELWGNGIHVTGTYDPDESSSTSRVIYNGPLYSGGWKPYNITEGTANGGHYYLYNGEYYPVRKEAAAQNYQPYVELPVLGKQYLTINGLASTIPTDNVGNYTTQYVGDLYAASPSNGWTYANITTGNTDANTTLLYKHSDDKYYPVLKKTEGGIRQAYVILPEGTRYLNPSGNLSETPYPNATTDNVVLYSGTLYKGGWRSYDITVATTSGGHYYKHTDGEYYPVLKETVNSTYQAYVNLPEGKRYLAGYGVSADPYPTTTGGQYSTIFFDDLYTGGWRYADITTGTAAGSPSLLYKHTDDKYYPISKETVEGVRQAYVDLPEGRRYLNPSGNLTAAPYPYLADDDVVLYSGELYTGGWRITDITAGTADAGHHVKYEGSYYPVKKEGTYYRPYVELPELGVRYLAGYELSENPYPTASDNNYYPTVYFGSLYRASADSYSRAEGLRRAVAAFIPAFSELGIEQGLHHRLAMLEFNRPRWYDHRSGTDDVNSPNLDLAPLSHAYNTHLIKDFLDVTDSDSAAELAAAVAPDQLPTSYQAASYLSYGLSLANMAFDQARANPIDEDGDGNPDPYTRPQVAIIIGDGGATGSYEAAQAQALEDDGVVVYFVHVTSTDYGIANVRSVLANSHRKEIPNSTTYYSTYTGANYRNGQRWKYLVRVNDYDQHLIDEIINMTEDISGADIELDADAVVQDVVSEYFNIVPGASSIKMFTADCIGKDGENTYVFDDTNLTPFTGTVTREGNTVKVSGFDFSANYCSMLDDGTYRGKALIVQIDVEPKPEIVGGYLPTNTSDSKVMDKEGTVVGVYEIPVVSVPIHIRLEKTGLQAKESAVFSIFRKALDGDAYEAAPYMQILVTGDGTTDALVKDVVGLDPDYFYKVVETGWSWKYTPDNAEGLSTETKTTNPFSFDNTPKDVTTKNAEDIKQNKFF